MKNSLDQILQKKHFYVVDEMNSCLMKLEHRWLFLDKLRIIVTNISQLTI